MKRAALIGSALCAAAAGRAWAAETDLLTKVRFNTTIADDIRPFLYAQSSGLFRQAGLDVELQRGQSGATTAEALIGGAADIGKTSMTSIITAYTHGLPFVLVAPGLAYHKDLPTAEIVVGANSPLRTPLDLQGKTVACSAIGDISYLGLRAIIDARGGDSSTVRWIELPPPAVNAAIEQGRVDAGLVAEPSMMQGVREGKTRLFVDMLSGYGKPILEVVYFCTRDYALKNRDTVARFARAIERAAAYSNTHVPETLALELALTGLDPKVAAEMRHGFSATTFDPAQIQPVIDLAAKYKLIEHGFDARELLQTVAPQK